ncbi:hypothetical protein E5288_WYG008711 [Bos mutus]|uniref:Uncharacterized protein n=1 Tax=Bos mutus TaxID=72004 RepID=A0A6B0S0R5_9CETA|nr:hypothetical protein [Bos mutus]
MEEGQELKRQVEGHQKRQRGTRKALVAGGLSLEAGMPPATAFTSPPSPVLPRNPEKGSGASRVRSGASPVHSLSSHPLPFSHSPQTIKDSAPGLPHSGKKTGAEATR